MSNAHRPVTVLTARFEDLVSRGLAALIGEDPALELVARDVPVEQLDARLREHAPAVAIVNFGSLRSPADVHRLHASHPASRLLVLANRPTAAEANQLVAFGATACLSKETEGRDVLTAIHLASRGLHVLPRSAAPGGGLGAEGGFALGGAPPSLVGPDLLTPREGEVLELLRTGRSNAETALALGVGVETVRTHRRNVYRKLGIRSRRELVELTTPARGSVLL